MRGTRFAVLTVCTANICRSPLMEVLLDDALDATGFEVASAGIHAFPDQPMDPMSSAELKRLGHAPGQFRSRPVEDDLLAASHLVLTAGREHLDWILADNPRKLRTTFTLLEFAQLCERIDDPVGPRGLVVAAHARRSEARGRLDVADPFRRKAKAHRQVAEQIDRAATVVATRLNRALADSVISERQAD